MEAGHVAEVRTADVMLVGMVEQMLRGQRSRVTGRRGHLCHVDVPGVGRVGHGLGKLEGSLDGIPTGFH